jgi:hypothetical protein
VALTFDGWLRAVDGEAIDNSPGQPHPQCTDLVRDYYIRVLGAPWGIGHVASFAHEWWTGFETDVDRPADWLSKVDRDDRAQPGDVAIWSAEMTRPWNSESGHVAVVVEDLDAKLRVMNQNFSGHGYAEYSRISKRHLLGYLRPIRRPRGAGGIRSILSSETEGELTMSEAAEIRRDIAALRDHLENLLTPGGQGAFSFNNAIIDEVRAMARVVDESSDSLKTNLAITEAIRESQITPQGFTYDAAILSLLQGLIGTVGQIAAGDFVDLGALASQLKGTLGDEAAAELGQRLGGG